MAFSGEALWPLILEPLGEEVFLRDYWGSRAILLPHGRPDLFQALCNLDQIEDYLFSVQPHFGDVRVVRENEAPSTTEVESLLGTPELPYSPQAFYTALGQGYTGVIYRVHQRWPELAQLAATASRRLHAGVNINLYLTGPESQGFKVHTDPHDTLVLQTHGSKHWVIYERTWGPPGEVPEVGAPILEVELKCGDALYLPRGFPHAARTAGDFSVHATLGIAPFTWGRLAQGMLATLLHDPLWQQVVPPGLLATHDLAGITLEIAERLATLANGPLVQRALRDHQAGLSSSPNPPPSGYLRSLASEIRPDTLLKRRLACPCTVTLLEDEVLLQFLGTVVRVPASAEHAVRLMVERPQFRVDELVGVDPEDRITLVRHLLVEGFLLILG
jgi:ribosomal protein L16 Arg81 hydroxylase